MEMIIGTVVRDAESKTFTSGNVVVNFTVALNDRYYSKQKGEQVEITRYVECQLWNRRNVADHILKGDLLLLTGTFNARAFDNPKTEKAEAVITFNVRDFDWKGSHRKTPVQTTMTEMVAEPAGSAADDLPF